MSDPQMARPSGDDPEVQALFARLPDADARAELVRLHLPLTESLARRFVGRRESIEDLRQVASLGLLNAIDRFDPDRGVDFRSYAATTIVGELKRHLRDRGWSVRVPRDLQESALLVNRAVADLWQELARSPTVGEVASRADLSEEAVLEAMEAARAYAAESLDEPSAAGATLADSLVQEGAWLETSDGWAEVSPRIRLLPKRERLILYLRFYRGLTQSEIAAQIGLSQMQISRLLAKTLTSLRGEEVPAEKKEGGAGP